MKITAYDDLYPGLIASGGTTLVFASGSNTAEGDTSGGGDVVGEPGDYTVVGLRSTVSLASNIGGGTVGDVLTIVQASPRLAMFATSSNSGVSFGSNSTRVSEVAAAGAAATASRADHIHDGIGTITASSSNTMQRGTFNLRAGTNVSFGLSDGDGDGEHDTLTINASASGGGSGSGLTIEEVDGTPTATATKLVLPNGTLSYAGTVATYTPAASGGQALPGDVAGLFQWFAADDITGKSDGDALTEWRNTVEANPGLDLIVASGSPTYETNELNSLPVVRLGGSTWFKFYSPAIVAPSFCFVIVCKFSSLANAYTGVLGFDATVDHGGYFVKSNGTSAVYPPGSATNYDGTGSATFDTTNWNYMMWNVKGLTYQTRRNGADDKASTAFTWAVSYPSALLGNQVVASRVMSGDIAEVLIYSRALSSSEITDVETYITGKYGL